MYSASVILTRSVLLDPTNPATQVAAFTGGLGAGGTSQRVHSHDLGGEFREYAAGRSRLVLDRSRVRTIPLTLKALTAAQQRLVDEVWPGRLLLFRDTYGTRVFGSYLSTQLLHIARSSLGDVADISLTFQRLTYVDQV